MNASLPPRDATAQEQAALWAARLDGSALEEADWAALSADEKALVQGSSVYRLASAHSEPVAPPPAPPAAPPVQPATAPAATASTE